jgi:hypothetical protein
LFDTVRIWEISPVWADFDKCHNLSKRNVKLILKISSDLEPLRGSSNKKTLCSTRSCVNWVFFGTRGPLKSSFHSRFKLAHSCQREPNLHTNSLNKLLLWKCFYFEKQLFKKIGLRIITINTLATVLHLKALSSSSLVDQRN